MLQLPKRFHCGESHIVPTELVKHSAGLQWLRPASSAVRFWLRSLVPPQGFLRSAKQSGLNVSRQATDPKQSLPDSHQASVSNEELGLRKGLLSQKGVPQEDQSTQLEGALKQSDR